jgi:hypothetical protein
MDHIMTARPSRPSSPGHGAGTEQARECRIAAWKSLVGCLSHYKLTHRYVLDAEYKMAGFMTALSLKRTKLATARWVSLVIVRASD